MNKVVTDLGCDHNLIPLVGKCFRDQFFAQTISVGISRIEHGDTEVEGPVHERDRFALGKIPPPTRGNRPQTEADLANR